MSYTVMTVTTDKTNAVIENIGSYIEQQKSEFKGEYYRHRIFHQPGNNMYVYIDEEESGIIIRLFIHHSTWGNRQISRRFSWIMYGIYSSYISKICRKISSVILELDESAQIQIEDKKEWCPIIILK